MSQLPAPNRTRPERGFWAGIALTVLLLSAVYTHAVWLERDRIGRFQIAEDGAVTIRPRWAEEWQDALARIEGVREELIDKGVVPDMRSAIDTEVDRAFEPVYAQIPRFADYHYSIVGEYTELAAILTGKGGEKLRGMLSDDIGLEASLGQVSSALNDRFQSGMSEAVSGIRGELDAQMDLEQAELGLLTEAVALTFDDVEARFRSDLVALRAGGAIAGALVAGRFLARRVATRMAAKAGTRVAAKTAVRAASPIGAGAVGVAACAWSGPFAVLCGAGAAAGAWFLTDAAIIAVDEAINRDDFEAELRAMVDNRKAGIKAGFADNYAGLAQRISRDLDARLKATLPRSPAAAVAGD